jgi:hypothetical protein
MPQQSDILASPARRGFKGGAALAGACASRCRRWPAARR